MPQNFLRGGNCPDAAPKLIFNIAMADAISADDRLARQAMEAFRRSQRPDGLINADTPTVKSNVIPAFSIYYLLMVHDHMMYLGDKALVKRHLPAIDGILGFFDRNLSEQGLVGKSGSPIMRHRYWSFIDWAGVWDSGVPAATGKGSGSVTMESLLYLYSQKGCEAEVQIPSHLSSSSRVSRICYVPVLWCIRKQLPRLYKTSGTGS